MNELERIYYTLVYKSYMNKERIFKLVEIPVVREYLKLLDERMVLDYEFKKSMKQNLTNVDIIKNKLLEVDTKINELSEDSLIVEYNDRMKKQTDLDFKLKLADFNLKNSCDHFFVKHNQYKNGSSQYCCLKCELDVRLNNWELEPISDYEYKKNDDDRVQGVFIDEFTDLNLAYRIYDGIIDAYPDISNSELSKYFRVARHFILEKGERKYDNHAKHLGLKK